MTGNEYQRAALRTASIANAKGLPEWAATLLQRGYPAGNLLLLNGVLGLGGESGEVEDLVKKHLFQGHPLDKEHIAKELGDIAWYLAVAAHGIGYELDTILQMNVDKLWARYPDGFDPECSLNRKEDDV